MPTKKIKVTSTPIPRETGLVLFQEVENVHIGRVFWTSWHALMVTLNDSDDEDEFTGPSTVVDLDVWLKERGYMLDDYSKAMILGYTAFGQQYARSGAKEQDS